MQMNRKINWLVVVIGLIGSLTACRPVQWTDKIDAPDRQWMLKEKWVPAKRLLADTAVFLAEKHPVATGHLFILEVHPHKGSPCEAPLCGRAIYRGLDGQTMATPWFPLQHSNDLRLLFIHDDVPIVEYFDAPNERLRYYAFRADSSKIYQTGWVSTLYLFRPEKSNWKKNTYTLFSMQEKLELQKRWLPLKKP